MIWIALNQIKIDMKSKANKTYEFKGKKVIAVPEVDGCEKCIFLKGKSGCEMAPYPGGSGKTQKEYGMPDCYEEQIIFKPAPDEKQD